MSSESFLKSAQRQNKTLVKWIIAGILLAFVLYVFMGSSGDKRGRSSGIATIRGRIINIQDAAGVEQIMELADNADEEDDLYIGVAYSLPYNVSEDIEGDFQCEEFSINPKPKVCFYPEGHPKEAVNARWEFSTLANMQHMYKFNSEKGKRVVGFLDIGANIGIYTVMAASEGYHVVAVEPDIDNIRQLHKAVKLGGLESRVTVLHNAVGLERGWHVDSNGEETGVRQITLDDLRPFCNFNKAVMRVDLEDQSALRSMSRLAELVDVKRVLVEKNRTNKDRKGKIHTGKPPARRPRKP